MPRLPPHIFLAVWATFENERTLVEHSNPNPFAATIVAVPTIVDRHEQSTDPRSGQVFGPYPIGHWMVKCPEGEVTDRIPV